MRKPVKNPRKPKPVLPAYCAFCVVRKTRLVRIHTYFDRTLESKCFTDVCITDSCMMRIDLSLVKSWVIYTGPLEGEEVEEDELVVVGSD